MQKEMTLESDMPHKHGWGHSLVSQVRELAAAAEVKHLVLFHHDPERTDDELDVMQEKRTDGYSNAIRRPGVRRF